MIAIFLAAVTAQPAAAAQPSFGFACKVEGTLGPDSKLAAFAQRRPLAFFVESKDSGSFATSRTIDPTKLLDGKKVTLFHSLKPGTYGAATGLSGEDIALTLSPSDSKTVNLWTLGFAPVNKGPSPRLTVGTCLLMDGITGAEFDQFAPRLSQMK